MKSRVEQAVEKKKIGYNCAQAVACTYSDLVGIDEQTMKNISEGLGLGMGNMEGTCGSIIGACIVGGLKSNYDMSKGLIKTPPVRFSKQILDEFKTQNTTITCNELKGIKTGKVIRACNDCVKDAAQILENVVFEKYFE